MRKSHPKAEKRLEMKSNMTKRGEKSASARTKEVREREK